MIRGGRSCSGSSCIASTQIIKAKNGNDVQFAAEVWEGSGKGRKSAPKLLSPMKDDVRVRAPKEDILLESFIEDLKAPEKKTGKTKVSILMKEVGVKESIVRASK